MATSTAMVIRPRELLSRKAKKQKHGTEALPSEAPSTTTSSSHSSSSSSTSSSSAATLTSEEQTQEKIAQARAAAREAGFIVACQILERAYPAQDRGYDRWWRHEQDLAKAEATKSSLLFGEMLPSGLHKLLDEHHLNAASARSLVDLGSGHGKLVLQAFVQYPNLVSCRGIELSPYRSACGMRALYRVAAEKKGITLCEVRSYDAVGPSAQRMHFPTKDAAKLRDDEAVHVALFLNADVAFPRSDLVFLVAQPAGGVVSTILTTTNGARTCEMRCQNMYDAKEAFDADIVICETGCVAEIPSRAGSKVCAFFSQLKPGAKLMTYSNIRRFYKEANEVSSFHVCPFVTLEFRSDEECAAASDEPREKYLTSWAPNNGHGFFTYRKM